MVDSLEKEVKEEEQRDFLKRLREGHIEICNVKYAIENNKLSDVRYALMAGFLNLYFECNGKNSQLSKFYFNMAISLSNNEEIQYSSDVLIPSIKQ